MKGMAVSNSIFPFLLFVAVAIQFQKSDSLKCYCNDCGSSESECSLDDPGGACYSKVTVMNGQEHRQKHCYSAYFAQSFCDIKSQLISIECCYGDYCNINLNPSLEQPESSNNNDSSIDNTQSTNEPTGATTLSCYKSNTKKSQTVSYCSTNVTIGGSCYHLIRKSSDGLVLSERHGCSESCKVENRNRAVRTCCNTTLCNFVNIKPPNTDSGIPLIPIPPLVLVTSSTSSAIQPSQTKTLSTAINHSTVSSSQLHVIDNIVAASSATATQPSSSPSITSSLYTVQPSASTSSTVLVTNNIALSSSMTYIIASISLGVLYVIVMVALCILITIVCYKQKKRQRSSAANKNKKNVKKSTDTLVS